MIDSIEDKEVIEESMKPFSDQVIDLYEKCLRNGLIISTSKVLVNTNWTPSSVSWI